MSSSKERRLRPFLTELGSLSTTSSSGSACSSHRSVTIRCCPSTLISYRTIVATPWIFPHPGTSHARTLTSDTVSRRSAQWDDVLPHREHLLPPDHLVSLDSIERQSKVALRLRHSSVMKH